MEDYKNTPDEFEAGESNIKAVAQQLWSGQLEKSIEIFRFNSEIFGQSADAHSSLADAYQQNKQLKLALVHYQKALLIEPNNDGLKQKLESLQ